MKKTSAADRTLHLPQVDTDPVAVTIDMVLGPTLKVRGFAGFGDLGNPPQVHLFLRGEAAPLCGTDVTKLEPERRKAPVCQKCRAEASRIRGVVG